jgi:hypothetical protein
MLTNTVAAAIARSTVGTGWREHHQHSRSHRHAARNPSFTGTMVFKNSSSQERSSHLKQAQGGDRAATGAQAVNQDLKNT